MKAPARPCEEAESWVSLFLFYFKRYEGVDRLLEVVALMMTSHSFALFSRGGRHSMASLWCVTQRKRLLKRRWNREAGVRRRSAYSLQRKYHNHLSHSEYCSIPHFHRAGNSSLKSYICGSFLCSATDCTGEFCNSFPWTRLKGRLVK